MNRAERRRAGIPAVDLAEEAVHLLRTVPAGMLASYYAGSIPFVLGFLYFWADMSRNPFAQQRLAEAALVMALLFVWMKFCHGLFGRRLRAHLAAEPQPEWAWRDLARLLLTQAILQPTGLFLIPLSAVVAVPLGWVYAAYQNATALAEPGLSPGKLARKAWKQAALWPGQNHLLLSILSGLALVVFLNWLVVCLTFPELLRVLTGIETVFSRSRASMLNTTFFTAMIGLTYLCVDPIIKAAYTLRCFYGESLKSGEDLKANLKRAGTPAAAMAAVVAIVFLLAGGFCASAGEAGAPLSSGEAVSGPGTTSPQQLDQAIDEVIRDRKYAWRMPRESVAETEKGPVAGFVESVLQWLRKALRTVLEWVAKVIKWFRGDRVRAPGGTGTGWVTSLNMLLYALVAVAAAALLYLLYRTWKKSRRPVPATASQPIQRTPDLADEDVGADELPVDGWTKLGRELLERGEFRLAVRAFYLASLAHLAERNLISIARFKSNREYEHELRRRGHSFPELLSAFHGNVLVFERIWYGMHDVNRELAARFAADVESMRATA